MTASTKTTSDGWFYADNGSDAAAVGWDGRFWPEIAGYRGYQIDAFVERETPQEATFSSVALESPRFSVEVAVVVLVLVLLLVTVAVGQIL